jgi:hypothetical protein
VIQNQRTSFVIDTKNGTDVLEELEAALVY